MVCIVRDDGEYYQDGYGTNTGPKFTTWFAHAWFGTLREARQMMGFLRRAGFRVKVDH